MARKRTVIEVNRGLMALPRIDERVQAVVPGQVADIVPPLVADAIAADPTVAQAAAAAVDAEPRIADHETRISRTDPGTAGDDRQRLVVMGGSPRWLDMDRVPLEAFGVEYTDYGDTSKAVSNSTAFQAAIAAMTGAGNTMDANKGKHIMMRPLPVYLADTVDLTGVYSLVFEGAGGASYIETGAFSSQFIGTLAVPMFMYDSTPNVHHQGPRFNGVNFQVPPGGNAIDLRNVTRWGFDKCTFRGIGSSTAEWGTTDLVLMDSDNASLGGSTFNGDCAWGYFNDCTFARYGKAINARMAYGFHVNGGEFTNRELNSTSIYGQGYHVRVNNPKMDGGTFIDWVGQYNTFQFNGETPQSPAIKLGHRTFGLDAVARTTSHNYLNVRIVGNNPTPALGIDIGEYAVDNTILYSEANFTTEITKHSLSRNVILSMSDGKWSVEKNINNDFALDIRNSNNMYPHGVRIYTNSGGSTSRGLVVVNRSGVAGADQDAFEVLSDGHVKIAEGASIGHTAAGKVSFFGVPLAVQQAANPDTSGATVAELEAEVNQLKAVLRTYGLIKT